MDIGYRTFSSWVTNLKPSHLHTTYRRREFVEWRGADRAPHTPTMTAEEGEVNFVYEKLIVRMVDRKLGLFEN